MWSVDPPPVTALDAARACARGVRSTDLAGRIKSSESAFAANSAALKQAADTHQLHLVNASTYSVPKLGDGELKKLYTQQMAKVGRPGREIYSAIIARARHGLCSYCQYGAARTLDHFVPKSGVPALSIDPWNLIPCCRDCNSALLEQYADDEDLQLLHPYSLPPVGRWLYAEINHSHPVTATFIVDPDADLATSIRKRLINQFLKLNLGRLYAVVAAQDIAEAIQTLSTHFAASAVEEVSDHLRGLSSMAFAYDDNSRRAVLFEALADDEWFCSNGYLG